MGGRWMLNATEFYWMHTTGFGFQESIDLECLHQWVPQWLVLGTLMGQVLLVSLLLNFPWRYNSTGLTRHPAYIYCVSKQLNAVECTNASSSLRKVECQVQTVGVPCKICWRLPTIYPLKLSVSIQMNTQLNGEFWMSLFLLEWNSKCLLWSVESEHCEGERVTAFYSLQPTLCWQTTIGFVLRLHPSLFAVLSFSYCFKGYLMWQVMTRCW